MPGASTLQELRFATIAFVVGMGVMAIEITASRLLAPHFGASMFVWTGLIVTVLLAMSFGYWVGGAVAERDAGFRALGFILCAAAAFMLFGIWIIGDFSASISTMLTAWTSASSTLFLGSLLVSFLVFACPVFMLASASPIILKAWSKVGGDVGKVSGRYFAISTIGSVVGTLAPTLVLVPAIGAQHTIELFAGLFAVLGIALLPRRKNFLGAVLAVPALGMTAWGAGQEMPKGVIFEKESPYQFIRVLEDGSRRYLLFNEGAGIQSMYDPSLARTGMYPDTIALAPLLRPFEDGRHRLLILGLAGGSVARQYLSFLPPGSSAEMTGVEVDPAVVDVARRFFGLDELPVRVVNQDARMFVAASKERYDVIVTDAYSTQLYIPPHLATEEFFALAKSRLVPGGLLVLNINAPSPDSPLFLALTNSVAKHFPHVAAMPIEESWNFIVFASDSPIDLAGATVRIPIGYEDIGRAAEKAFPVGFDPRRQVFTDDRAPVEMLTDSMIIQEAFKR